jgi:hypothetical protein
MGVKIDLQKFLAVAAMMSQGLNTACVVVDNTGTDTNTTNTTKTSDAGTDTGTAGETTAGESTGDEPTGGTGTGTGEGTTMGSTGTPTTGEEPTGGSDDTGTTGMSGFQCTNGDPIEPMFVCDENPLRRSVRTRSAAAGCRPLCAMTGRRSP